MENGKIVALMLANINDGRVAADFQRAVQLVADDLADMTKGDEPREITLKVKFLKDPNSASRVNIESSCLLKLAPAKRLDAAFLNGVDSELEPTNLVRAAGEQISINGILDEAKREYKFAFTQDKVS